MYLFYFTFAALHNVRIKMYDTNSFLGGEMVKDSPVILVTEDDANVYKIKSSQVKQKEVLITYLKSQNLTWEYSTNKQKLVCSKLTEDPKVQFNMIPVDFFYKTYWIAHKNQCLTYNVKNLFFELKNCDEKDKNQLFQFDNVDDIDFNEHNANIVLSLENRKQYLINKIQQSQHLEYEGNNLIENIHGMLKKITHCLNEMEICNFDYDYFVQQYKKI